MLRAAAACAHAGKSAGNFAGAHTACMRAALRRWLATHTRKTPACLPTTFPHFLPSTLPYLPARAPALPSPRRTREKEEGKKGVRGRKVKAGAGKKARGALRRAPYLHLPRAFALRMCVVCHCFWYSSMPTQADTFDIISLCYVPFPFSGTGRTKEGQFCLPVFISLAFSLHPFRVTFLLLLSSSCCITLQLCGSNMYAPLKQRHYLQADRQAVNRHAKHTHIEQNRTVIGKENKKKRQKDRKV